MVFHLEKEVSKLDLTRGTEPQSKLQRSISLNIFSHLRSHDRKKHPVSIAPVLLVLYLPGKKNQKNFMAYKPMKLINHFSHSDIFKEHKDAQHFDLFKS